MHAREGEYSICLLVILSHNKNQTLKMIASQRLGQASKCCTGNLIPLICHNFFFQKYLVIRCILSLSQAFLKNTELKIFGRHQKSNQWSKKFNGQKESLKKEKNETVAQQYSINTELECLFAHKVVVTQWQSTCALSKRSWVRFPVATKYFNSVLFKKHVKEREYIY